MPPHLRPCWLLGFVGRRFAHGALSIGFFPFGQPKCKLLWRFKCDPSHRCGSEVVDHQMRCLGGVHVPTALDRTALTANDIVLVPIRSGVGARLGVNLGYLKFTPSSTWNPF